MHHCVWCAYSLLFNYVTRCAERERKRERESIHPLTRVATLSTTHASLSFVTSFLFSLPLPLWVCDIIIDVQRGYVFSLVLQAQRRARPSVQRHRGHKLYQFFHQEQDGPCEGDDGLPICAVRSPHHRLCHGRVGEAWAEV